MPIRWQYKSKEASNHEHAHKQRGLTFVVLGYLGAKLLDLDHQFFLSDDDLTEPGQTLYLHMMLHA